MTCRRSFVALIVSLTAAVAPSGAMAADVGINPAETPVNSALDAMGQLGAGWVRAFVRWDQIEPNGRDRWDPNALAPLDQLASSAQLRGLKVVAVVTGAPAWANGSTDPYVPPRNPADFGHFMGALAARERGKVTAWEIWNEPDEAEFWHGPVGPQFYAPLLQAASSAIGEADPAALVLAGASTGNDYQFLEGIYAAGAGSAFSGVAVHTDTACLVTSPDSYYREADGRIGRFSFLGFREVQAVLERNGHGDRPILMTELGWSTTRTRCSRGAFAGQKAAGVSEAKQADYLKLAYRCLSNYPYVRAALWFNLRDTSDTDTELTRYGLLRPDGSRKPAYDALAAIGHGGAASGGPCGDFAPPSLRVISPATDAVYDRSLNIRAAASDGSGALGRITFYANGAKIRSFTGSALANDRSVGLEWMGARSLPYGPVNVTVEALDASGNTVRKEVTVRRVNPATMPVQRTRVSLRLTGKGRKRRLRGQVRAPGAAFVPGGKVLIRWQYQRKGRLVKRKGRRVRLKGRWVTLHKASKNANRSFRVDQKLRKKGRWRVTARYNGQRPFASATSRRISFRAR